MTGLFDSQLNFCSHEFNLVWHGFACLKGVNLFLRSILFRRGWTKGLMRFPSPKDSGGDSLRAGRPGPYRELIE